MSSERRGGGVGVGLAWRIFGCGGGAIDADGGVGGVGFGGGGGGVDGVGD